MTPGYVKPMCCELGMYYTSSSPAWCVKSSDFSSGLTVSAGLLELKELCLDNTVVTDAMW